MTTQVKQNSTYITPVIILNKAPIPNVGEQIIVITKESSIAAIQYAEFFHSKHIIIAIKKNHDDSQDILSKDQNCNQEKENLCNEKHIECNENQDDSKIEKNQICNYEYSGVLCYILDKIFEEKDEQISQNKDLNFHKIKILVQIKSRIKFKELQKQNFIYKNQNFFFPERKFAKDNLIFKNNESIGFEQNSQGKAENFFFTGILLEDNAENFEYVLENIFFKTKTENLTKEYQDEDLKSLIQNFNEKTKKSTLSSQKTQIASEEKIQELMQKFKNYCILYDLKSSYEIISALTDNLKKIDLIASKFDLNHDDLFEFLLAFNPDSRIDLLLRIIQKAILKNQIDENLDETVRKNVEKTHKIYLLNEKGKEISRQLDDLNGEISDFDSMEEKLSTMIVSDLVRKKIKNEIKRIKIMNQSSSDAAVIRNYLDWIFDIPFGIYEKLNMNFSDVSRILNEEHYGMEKVKERILQYLAVDFRGGSVPKAALLLIGPPGVGKTSLSRKIAQALGRKFIRISLGGVRDEADIRGHRRTYLGSMPGKIMQAIRDSGSSNPLILLDEIDKIGHDFRGDPAAALLEVLDKEQNNEFLDHYLDIPFDLSKVLFICTANNFDGISRPLYDRMEIIWLSSYSDEEKVQIAENYMIPEQKKAHHLKDDEICFEDNIMQKIIREYTYEAGVRGLEEQISIIMRKTLLKILNENSSTPIQVTKSNLADFLGLTKFIKYDDITESGKIFGIANGLAWNEAGGSVLTIECVSISLKDSKENDTEKQNDLTENTKIDTKKKKKNENELDGYSGSIKLTGKLGDVMQESIQTAFSYIKANRKEFGVLASSYNNSEIHLHVPEGATPKDGPSAGITIFSALLSLFLKKPLKPSVAMTGEITLTGRILPIGGLKEKILAAKKHGIKQIIIPAKNLRDLEEIPLILKQDVEIHLINHAREVIKILFSNDF